MKRWCAMCLWLIAGLLLAGCGRSFDEPKLDYTPAAAAYVPPGDGGTVDALYYLLTGWAHSDESHYFGGGDPQRPMTIPIPAFLIKHGDDYILVDTGLNGALAENPAAYLGKTVAHLMEKELDRLVMKPGWDVPSRLKAMGVDPQAVEYVVLTHAHFDHTGANRAFPDATFMMSPGTLKAGRDGGLFGGYIAEDFPESMKIQLVTFDNGAPFLTFAGGYDLMGDRSVILAPMPGHDPECLGVFVRTAKGPVLLVGDAAYNLRNIREKIMLGFLFDPDQTWDTLHRLHQLSEAVPEILIVPSHDPQVYRSVLTAPAGF